MLRRRVIPCLDVADGRVVKGTRFVDLVDEGDPPELAERYAREGADELVFLDITAAPERRGTLLDIVERTARRAFIPLTVGGGVRTVDEMRDVLRAGADKVSLNTAAVADPELIGRCAARFGRQAVVVAIDARRTHGADRRPGRSSSRAAARRRAWMPWSGRNAPSRWAPANCWSRPWIATGPAKALTPNSCAPSSGESRCRSSRPAARRDQPTSSRPSATAAPTRSSRPRSSIAGSTRSRRSRRRWRRPDCRSGSSRRSPRERHRRRPLGADGLATAIVQDAVDGRVLMVAHMDAEALAATLETGEVHFHSRSRDRLWRKGETSGNVLRLVSIATDCDGDAVLVTVDPTGPTCHRGTRSCFDLDGAPPTRVTDPQGFAWLETLWSTIASRAAERPAGSYTTTLLDGGVDATARKVTEEATEVLMAAKDDAAASTDVTREALAGEAADLLYHALVLLAERDLAPSAVIDTLRARHARCAGVRQPTSRPISRRRLPRRTSSHSPATGSGIDSGSVTRVPLTVTPPPAMSRRASPLEATSPAPASTATTEPPLVNVKPPVAAWRDARTVGIGDGARREQGRRIADRGLGRLLAVRPGRDVEGQAALGVAAFRCGDDRRVQCLDLVARQLP